MNGNLRSRILTSVSAGVVVGVLGAGGMAVATGGPSYPTDVVEGACSAGAVASDVASVGWAADNRSSAWFGGHRKAAE